MTPRSVFTGLSGLGKSSLASDTIFAEGQRRYVESLSAYARSSSGRWTSPTFSFIDGLSPAVSIDQKARAATRARPSARSRGVRLPAAAIRQGREPHCPTAVGRSRGRPAASSNRVTELEEKHQIAGLGACSPRPQGRVRGDAPRAAGQGYSRARVNGVVIRLDSVARRVRLASRRR